ncbi:hypothetical protein ABPG72_021461 [Tetrahymena utriculariae]
MRSSLKQQPNKQNNSSKISKKEFDQREKDQFRNYLESLKLYQRYYVEIFPLVIQPYQRPLMLSFLLLIISLFQEAALSINKQQINNQDYKATNLILFYLNKTNGKSLFNGTLSFTQGVITVLIIISIINLLFISIVGITICLYLSSQKRSTVITAVAKICASISSIYNYIVFIPALNLSFLVLNDSTSYSKSQILAYINLPLTLVIGIIMTYHDHDFSFASRDYLVKRETKLEVFRQILLCVVCWLNVYISENLLLIVIFFYSVLKLILYYREQFYLKRWVSCLYIMLSCTLVSFVLLMGINSIIKEFTNIGVLWLLQIGLACRLGYQIHTRFSQNLTSVCIGKSDLRFLSLDKVDIYIRQLNENLSFFFEDYIEKGQAIIFETIYISHKLQCDAKDYKCFCYEFKRDESQFSLDEYIGQEYRKKFIFQYFANVYETILNNPSEIKDQHFMMLNYISYLFEIMNISTRSYNTIFNYSNKMFQRQLLSLKEFQSLNTIFLRLNKQFENFFKSPKIQNQRIQMMLIIDFDEYIEVFRQQTRYYLLILGEYYDYLCSNFIKLEELHSQSKQILEKLDKCQQLQNWLFDINPDDKQLLFLTTIYSNILDFKNRKLADFVVKSQQLTQKFILPQEINLQKFFNSQTCAIYASLNTTGGEIKKVSNSFSNIFNFKNQSIITKSLNQLIPRGMVNDHEDFLNNFKSKGNMAIINQGERMVFGQNSQGFIFPIMIRLKIENALGELGICAHITNLYETNEFIFIDDNENISDVTENLYQNALSAVYSKSYLIQKNINQILPIALIIKQLQEYNLSYQTVMILQKKQLSQSPLKGQETFNFNQGQTFQLLNQKLDVISERDVMFSVNVQIRQIFTQIGKKYYYFEISHINHLRDYDERRNYLNKLRECVKLYEEYDKTNSNGKTFSEINNLKFDQLNKLEQTASKYVDSEKQLNQTTESESKYTQVDDLSRLQESSVKKRSNNISFAKRIHLNEQELLLFQNKLMQKNNLMNQSCNNQNLQEKSEESSLQLQKYFNFEFSRLPLQEEAVLQELQQNDLHTAENQLLFSPKENSHRQLLMQYNNQNDINSQAEEENQFQQNQNSSKKFQQISTEIFSRVAQEQEQQTASSPTLKNQSQFKRKLRQKLKKNQRRKEKRQTKKIVIKKYESTNRIYEDSSKFSNDQNNFYEKKEDKGNDAQSVQSVNTNLSEQKKQQIINQINSQNSSFIVKIFIRSVIISFITLVCVSSVQYDQLNHSIDRYYLDFQQLNLFNQMNDINLIVLSQKTFLELFQNFPQLGQSTLNQTFLMAERQRSSTYLNQQLENFTQKTLRAINADPSQNYQRVFVTNTTSLNLTGFSVQNSNHYIKNFTIIYEFLIYRQQFFEVLYPQNQSFLAEESNNRMDFLWDNYKNIFTTAYKVQGTVENQVRDEFSYIDNVQLLNLIVLLVVVGVLAILVIPMNILGQIQAEKILKLLGSFQPDKLQKYVDLIEYCIIKVDQMVDYKLINYRDLDEVLKQNSNQIVSSKEHYNKEMNIEQAKNINIQSNVNGEKINIIQRIQNKRTRSVASFNSLQKISLAIILISLVVIFIQMIYPIVSLLVIQQYKKEGQVVISERIAIFDATSVLLDYHANHYGYWLTNFRLQQSPSSQDFYRADLQMQNIIRLHSSGDDFLQKVSNIMADTQIKRRNQQKFNNIFITMLNQDICEVIQSYPKYFASEIQQIDCQNIMNGVLSRGFIITMKQISQYFTDFFQLYQQPKNNLLPQKNITKYLLDVQKQSNLIDQYNQLIRYFKLISFALDNYLIESQVDYYNYIIKVNQYLFMMQLTVIVMTFIFGWTFFYKKFTKKLKEVKNLLKLFHINLILDNQIFMAYFKKNKNQLV